MKTKFRFAVLLAAVALILAVFAIPVLATDTTTAPAATTPAEATAKFPLSTIIPIAIAVALVVFLVIFFCVMPKRREKTKKFFRGTKTELKKITWYSAKQTWKGTAVVCIVAVTLAVVIGLLDLGFNESRLALQGLFT